MKKGLIYIWSIIFSASAVYTLFTTSKDFTSDARANENRFQRPINFIDSFNFAYKRLPLKQEFNSWQRNTLHFVNHETAIVCNDTFEDPNSESLNWQYLRSKNDFNFGRKFQMNNVDLCNEYAVATWNGDEWVYYLSWNKKYSNEYSWTQSITLSLFYILVAFSPVLYNKITRKPKSA